METESLRFHDSLIINELRPLIGIYYPPARPTKVRLFLHKSKQNPNFFFENGKINIGKRLDISLLFPMFVM